LFIKVTEGQNEPFLFTEQFVTSDGLPDPPTLEDIRLVSADGGNGQMCEVEWRPSNNPRGQITRYYVGFFTKRKTFGLSLATVQYFRIQVQISGRMRHISPESKIPPTDHYPQGVDFCSNYEHDLEHFINPSNFPSFFACKYGPLKVSKRIWEENNQMRIKNIDFYTFDTKNLLFSQIGTTRPPFGQRIVPVEVKPPLSAANV